MMPFLSCRQLANNKPTGGQMFELLNDRKQTKKRLFLFGVVSGSENTAVFLDANGKRRKTSPNYYHRSVADKQPALIPTSQLLLWSITSEAFAKFQPLCLSKHRQEAQKCRFLFIKDLFFTTNTP